MADGGRAERAASSARCCSARSPAPACCRSARAQFEATIARGGVGVGREPEGLRRGYRAGAAGTATRRAAAASAAGGDGRGAADAGARSTVARRRRRALDGTTDAPAAKRRCRRAAASRRSRASRALLDRIDALSRRGARRSSRRRAPPDRLPGPGLRRPLPRSPGADRGAARPAPRAAARRDRAPPRALDVATRTRSASPR